MENRKSEICGNKDMKVMVASSGIGPFSQAVCQPCAAMAAESKNMLECVGEPGTLRPGLTYYDRELDNYIDYNTGEVSVIKLKNGTTFKSRTEYVTWYKEKIK